MSPIKIRIHIVLIIVFFFKNIAFGQNRNIIICSGKSVTLFPTENNAFAYRWSPSSSLSATNVKNPTATPSATTDYTVVSSARTAVNLVRNGDFELGNQVFDSKYTFAAGGSTDNGSYSVSDNSKNHNFNFSNCRDHSNLIGGKMLIADGASGTNGVAKFAEVWSQVIPIVPNKEYAFSSWITNLAGGAISSLKFSINGTQVGQTIASLPGLCNWQEFYVVWNSGSATTATISIAEGTGSNASGNDFALDDITFYTIIEAQETITVTVVPQAISPVVTGKPSLCLAETTNLTSSLTGGTWSSTNPSVATINLNGKVAPVSGGNTSIIYTLNDVCNTSSLPFNITVTAPPALDTITGLSKLTIGQTSLLKINLPGGTWVSSNNNIVTIAPDGTIKAINDGTANITYTLNGLCPAFSLPFKIDVIRTDDLYAPNAFTPNSDGNNDEFKIFGSLVDKIELSIFNQWGQLVFSNTDLTKGWDGTYKGEKQPTGVYVFTAKLKMISGEEVLKKGSVNLIR